MEQQVKNEWIINNQNIFGLQQDINLSISSIQYEILNQVKGKNINSISDYLGAEIDISKEIRLTKKLTIEKVFAEFLGFENINPLEHNNFNCSLILGYLQLSLFKEYSENKYKNILTFSEYKTQYNSLLNNFLTSNIDTDEQDFIKSELILCNNLLTEMNKPVYSVLSPLNEVLDKPCEYKKNLINSIDKRKKFLEQKANEKYPKIKALPPQQNEKPKQPELNKIWLSEPKISIDDLLTLGIEKGIWNDEYQVITAKGSLYGTGKTMLGSLFIALKGFAVSENIDYKEAGKVFCSFFNVPINEKTKEPYKAFSSGNEKLIRELKRAFNIK